MPKLARISTSLVALASLSGCMLPLTFHRLPGQKLVHGIIGARVYRDCLSIQGGWNQEWAVYNYGVKVLHAQDDKGNDLQFKSFMFVYQKDMDFELTFTKPHEEAQSISIDVLFVCQGETQRITKTLLLDENVVGGHRRLFDTSEESNEAVHPSK